jgi:hypothetical protein
MYESIEETFSRLKSVFNIQIKCSKKNLKKLQNGLIDLSGKENLVKDLLNPSRINMNHTWDDVELMVDNITSDSFRNTFVDSSKKGWVYSWFCLDHIGFTGKNPRMRDAHHHSVFDRYVNRVDRNNSRDIVQWHYHPLPVNGNYNSSGITYLNSGNIWEILSRKIIDRQWFPSVYRPGFHAERPDSHWFLEQWIPFDYGNQSMKEKPNDVSQPDLSGGRWGDWKNAPTDWKPYHPSHNDYQLPGNCHRSIFRCLNMEARLREITEEDIVDGFLEARTEGKSCISFTNHDFRDMEPEINKVRSMIERVSKTMPDVEFYYVDALTAAREMLDLQELKSNLKVFFNQCGDDCLKMSVSVEGKIFGQQPYLAIKTKDGRYLWENLDKKDLHNWSFVFDEFNADLALIEKVGVAINSPAGISEVIVYDVTRKEFIKKKDNVFL